jgi:RNA-directed DNA polymerase
VARYRELGNLEIPIIVQQLQEALHAKAKRSPDYRFYTLYDKLYRDDIMAEAYRRCRENGGSAGVDGQTFEDIKKYGERRWLDELKQELKERRYQAGAIRRVWIPKANGKLRPLGISTIRDRVVMTAMVLVLGPIFEADLQPEQHAYRPGRNALTAVEEVNDLLREGYRHVVDADLSAYFDTIPHPELMKSVARRVSDRQILHLIKMWLTAPVEEDDGKGGKKRTTQSRDEKRGTPQGSPLSPLLANIYMRRFILGWSKLGYAERFGALIVNYADDMVICCMQNANEALNALRNTMEQLKLTVNEEKTRVCEVPRESFDFLGYTFGRCYSPKTGKAYIAPKPSKKSIRKVVEKITAETDRKTTAIRTDSEQVQKLNDVLRGWANYFKLGPVSKAYKALEMHTTARLRRWLGVKHKVEKERRRSRFTDGYLHKELGLIRLPDLTKSFPWARA